MIDISVVVIEDVDVGAVVKALKKGKIVFRKGWNGKNMFVFKQIPAEIDIETIPKMQSVPSVAKTQMLRNNVPIKYTNQLAIVQEDGRIDSWVPSVSDFFAEDWVIADIRE